MQANSQLLTPEITTSITGTNHVCRATKPTERIILMLPLQKSVCEPHCGSHTDFCKGSIKMIRSVGLVARQTWFVPVMLVVISGVSSWEFACITPFVAFAVAAGYALSARGALLTVMAIWLVNQAIGFAVLNYPGTIDTVLWGFAIGAAALLAAVLACATLRLGLRNNVTAVGTAFVLAFGAYEGGLFLVTFAMGGQDAFTPAIVGHVALLNLGWTVGLVGTYEILRYSGAITAERRRVSSAPFPV